MISLQTLFTFLFCLVCVFGGASARTAAPTPHVVTRIQSEEKTALDVFVATIRNARHHLAAAAVARCVSIFSMYPIDTFKVRRKEEIKKSLDFCNAINS